MKPSVIRLAFLAAMLPGGFTQLIAAEPGPKHGTDWPQFLGANRDGISREIGLNFDWNARPPKVLWRVPLGNGFSSLTIVGERLYTMTQRGTRDLVVCLDAATGKEIWAYDAAPSYVDTQRQGAGPRATPTYVDGKLYCLLPAGGLLCLHAIDGKRVWETDMFKASG